MGKTQSILEENGYTVQKQVENGVIATTKEGDHYFVREVHMSQADNIPLMETDHPHIVSYKNSFQAEKMYYVVRDHCHGGSLADMIKQHKESGQEFQEDEILTWIVQICMALKYSHANDVLYKNLTPERILFTEYGTLCLDGFELPGKNRVYKLSSSTDQQISYSAPETFTNGPVNDKSDIWSMGCFLYELCTLEVAFTAGNMTKLNCKIMEGPYPTLPQRFSADLSQLLNDIFQTDPRCRPTADEILARHFIIDFMTRKSKGTLEDLQANLDKLRALLDSLENLHQGTTIGSLTGGVIGAAGGITTIVGLILSPFTLGASLVVTGVGIGVAVAGGATAGISNATNMIKQSIDRQSIRSIIKEFSEKMNSFVASLQQINESMENLRQNIDSIESEGGASTTENIGRLGARVGRGVGGISELVRLVQVLRVGKVAAQTARVVRVAEAATGILSAVFVAVDIFFIALDAKEIHNIREAKAAQANSETNTSRLELLETDANSELLPPSDPETERIKSETMKFIKSVRQKVESLQKIMNELSEFTSLIAP